MLEHGKEGTVLTGSFQGWLYKPELWGLTRNPSKAGTDGNTPPRTAESYADSQAVGEDGEGGEQ
eukprot:scaffold43750_cov20-Tisochrysis_lutea.AAC.1